MPNEILRASLSIFHMLNMNINSSNFILMSLIVSIPGISFISANIFVLFSSGMNEIDNIVNFLNGTLTVTQILNRVIVFVKYREMIKNLINNFNNPLPFEILPPENQKRIKELTKNVKNFTKSHRIASYVVLVCYVLRPAIFGKREFPDFYIKSDTIMQSPYFELVYLWNVFNVILVVMLLLASNLLVFALVTKLVVDIGALKYYLRRIDLERVNTKADEAKCIKYVSQCVDYHIQLKRFAKDICKLCVPFFTVLVASAVLTICTALYNFNNQSFSTNNFGYTSFKICGYNYDLLIYLFIGTVIREQMSFIGDAVYEGNWTAKTSPKIRKSLVMIIHQAQQEIRFVVFGRVRIELPSFISLVQLSFSINTLLQTLNEKNI